MWYDAWDDWCCTRGHKLQKYTALWYVSKNDPQKDIESGRAEWIKCLDFWTRFGQQFEQSDEEEESSSSEEVGLEGTGESEEEEEQLSEEELGSGGTGESEEEEEESSSSEEVGSEGTGESEGFSLSGEESSSESVWSNTHSSKYSERSSGEICCTEDKREEMENINICAIDRGEESQRGIFANKRKAGEESIDSYSSKHLRDNTNFTSEGEM